MESSGIDRTARPVREVSFGDTSDVALTGRGFELDSAFRPLSEESRFTPIEARQHASDRWWLR